MRATSRTDKQVQHFRNLTRRTRSLACRWPAISGKPLGYVHRCATVLYMFSESRWRMGSFQEWSNRYCTTQRESHSPADRIRPPSCPAPRRRSKDRTKKMRLTTTFSPIITCDDHVVGELELIASGGVGDLVAVERVGVRTAVADSLGRRVRPSPRT